MEYIVHHEGGKQPSGALQRGLQGLINGEGLALCPCPSILCKVLNYWSQIPLWTKCSPSMSDCLLSVWVFAVISSLHRRWDSKMRSCHEREFDLGMEKRQSRAGQDQMSTWKKILKTSYLIELKWKNEDISEGLNIYLYMCKLVHSQSLPVCVSLRFQELFFTIFFVSQKLLQPNTY